MDQRLKQLIIRDYKEAFKNLNEIVSRKRFNCFVLKPNQYLIPSILCADIPSKDEEGEFKHYNIICETLEKLLTGERTDKEDYTCRFNDASYEIVRLLKNVA
jgi:hypothetical protein